MCSRIQGDGDREGLRKGEGGRTEKRGKGKKDKKGNEEKPREGKKQKRCVRKSERGKIRGRGELKRWR
jgi:hypothetical protein